MPRQLMFATVWGLLDTAAGPYPLDKLPAIVRKVRSLGYAGIVSWGAPQ
jgi:hypothetical protein